VTFAFPSTALSAGAYGVIVKNLAAFQSRYGSSINVLGTYTDSLNNGGETIAISNGFDQVLHSFTYDDAWYPQTDGGGYSLVIQNPAGALPSWDMPTSWRASYMTNGLPGQDDFDNTPPTVQSAMVQVDTSPNQLVIQFSEDIGTSADASHFLINQYINGNIGASIPFAFNYNPTTKKVTCTFTGTLADGNYLLRIPTGAIHDLANNATTSAYSSEFFALVSDANHDRTINSVDFAVLASNFGKSGGVTFGMGDFNYDGTINALDFNAFASRFGSTLLA
jgi:hypothetical protein